MAHPARRFSLRRATPLLAAGFALGTLTTAASSVLARDPDTTYRKLRVFTQVLNHIEQSYVEPIPQEQLLYGAVQGMLQTLDPHSTFMPPEEFKRLKEDTAGEFGGLGLEITQKDGTIVVVAPVEGAPAARAGLQAGDVIAAVDGKELGGSALQDAWKLLRGAAGTKVVLRIKRAAWPEPKDVALIRERVRIHSVEHACLEDGYGHVRIKSFQERVGKELGEALIKLQQGCVTAPGAGLRGLVLDLRNNPGGLLDEAVRVADTFLTDGDIVTTEGRNRRPLARHKAHPKDTQPSYPLIVLINEGSASASEIVAGALQDHGRALVMGTPSFGKGSVQTFMELEDGSGLKLTVARYFTPKGRSIQELGISPDVRVEEARLPEGDAEAPAPEASVPVRERDLRGHLRNTNTNPVATLATVPEALRRDVPLKTALDYLKAWRIFAGGRLLGKDDARP